MLPSTETALLLANQQQQQLLEEAIMSQAMSTPTSQENHRKAPRRPQHDQDPHYSGLRRHESSSSSFSTASYHEAMLSDNPKTSLVKKEQRQEQQKPLKDLRLMPTTSTTATTSTTSRVDAIVVGSGLAGMAAALTILDRGGSVILLEKEPWLGGNSKKASSGINACCKHLPNNNRNNTTNTKKDKRDNEDDDTLESFRNDTLQSAGEGGDVAHPYWELIDTLVTGSAAAVEWLRHRVNIDLSVMVQLGGHSHRRTYRPSSGFVGTEIVYRMQTALQAYQTPPPQKPPQRQTLNTKIMELSESTPRLTIYLNTRVIRLLHDGVRGRVIGVECETPTGTQPQQQQQQPPLQLFYASHVILTTGGFASDRSPGSYLAQYRPDYINFGATAGAFSTGDGIALATALGASVRDMEKVQLHPTGFVDPNHRDNPNKVLAAELLRGVGGILIDKRTGQRFCNELGTRSYISNRMLSLYKNLHSEASPPRSQHWNSTNSSSIPTFFLVLSEEAAMEGKQHVDLYLHKGLLTKIVGVTALAQWTNLPRNTVWTTLRDYYQVAATAQTMDEFGKTVFRNVPRMTTVDDQLEESIVLYVGEVTPVLHYCMGGLLIDTLGRVLHAKEEDDNDDDEATPVEGLYAAGEVTGGVHGNNRLGGNSLLECVVFGTRIGQSISISNPQQPPPPQQQQQPLVLPSDKYSSNGEIRSAAIAVASREITPEELAQHSSNNDFWVVIHGWVYNLTNFANLHPGGSSAIQHLAGTDATVVFDSLHSLQLLEAIHGNIVGKFQPRYDHGASTTPGQQGHKAASMTDTTADMSEISLAELRRHNQPGDYWMALFGIVYDITEFSSSNGHPGGSLILKQLSGQDATSQFQVHHKSNKKLLRMIESDVVGKLKQGVDDSFDLAGVDDNEEDDDDVVESL
jgi:flavocytochrome c